MIWFLMDNCVINKITGVLSGVKWTKALSLKIKFVSNKNLHYIFSTYLWVDRSVDIFFQYNFDCLGQDLWIFIQTVVVPLFINFCLSNMIKKLVIYEIVIFIDCIFVCAFMSSLFLGNLKNVKYWFSKWPNDCLV